MKFIILIAIAFALPYYADGTEPQIELSVNFIEVAGPLPDAAQAIRSTPSFTAFVTNSVTNLISDVDINGHIDLLAAPKLTVQSGSNATIKVVTEYIYPTDIDVRHTAITNGNTVTRGIELVPCNFKSRDVGVILHASSVYYPENDTVFVELTAEVVTAPTWKSYPVKYIDCNGNAKECDLQQPFFHVRKISPCFAIHNNSTIVMGGLTTNRTVVKKDKVPVLGSIPWLGRLFRSCRTVTEQRDLLTTISVKVVK